MNIKIKIENEKAYIYTPYNKNFVQRIKKIRGIWNGNAWVVNYAFVPAVREILKDIYGYDDTDTEIETVTLRITFLESREEYHDDIRLFGKTIASAYGRDSGAKLGEDAALIKGSAYSGGSVKNWRTIIDAGSVIILNNVPKIMYEKKKELYNTEEIMIEVVEKDDEIDVNKLREEKERLLKRIAEIDRILATQG